MLLLMENMTNVVSELKQGQNRLEQKVDKLEQAVETKVPTAFYVFSKFILFQRKSGTPVHLHIELEYLHLKELLQLVPRLLHESSLLLHIPV